MISELYNKWNNEKLATLEYVLCLYTNKKDYETRLFMLTYARKKLARLLSQTSE